MENREFNKFDAINIKSLNSKNRCKIILDSSELSNMTAIQLLDFLDSNGLEIRYKDGE